MRFIVKIVMAVVAIAAIVVGVASQALSAIPTWKVLVGAAALAALIFLVALVHAYVVGTFRELLFRWGAIDTRWLWTPDYPEGFKRYWRQSREDKK
jgi:uncharacterized membrane protein